MGIFKRIFGVGGRDDSPRRENWYAIAQDIAIRMEGVREDWFAACVKSLQDRLREEDVDSYEIEVKNVHIGGEAELAAKAYQLCLASDYLAMHEYIPPRDGADFADILGSMVCGAQLEKCLPYISRYNEVWNDGTGKQIFRFNIDVASYITDHENPLYEVMCIGPIHPAFALANHAVVATAFGDVKTVKGLQEISDKRNAAEEWFEKGLALIGSELYEEAIQCYDAALEIKPEYFDAWFWKGNALVKLERHKDAIQCYDAALEIKPEYAFVWYSKGQSLYILGDGEEAIRCYDKALEINSEDAIVWCFKGIALYTLKRYEEAIRCFDAALEIKPEYTDAWQIKGVALIDLERYEEGIRCFDSALEIDPNLVLDPSTKKSKMIAEEKLREQ
jgi:tetratricopeptide (TPR) repeat protein